MNNDYFDNYLKEGFNLLKEYRNIPEIKQRAIQDSLNKIIPDSPARQSIEHGIIELERQIQNNAWEEEQVKTIDIAMKSDAAKPHGLFGLFKVKEQANNANPAESVSSNKRK